MSQDLTNEQAKYSKQAVLARTIGTGASMGVAFYFFWSIVSFFKFTSYPAHYYIKDSINMVFDIPRWAQIFVTAFVMVLISICLALVYYVLAKKVRSIWMGIAYGAIIALMHLFIIHPLFIGESLFFHSAASTFTIFNMHILFGISIGYSISFDYTESLCHRKEIQVLNKQG